MKKEDIFKYWQALAVEQLPVYIEWSSILDDYAFYWWN